MATTILLKRGLQSDLTTATLLAGEPAFTVDSGKLYIGDGTTKVLINPTYGSAATYEAGNSAGELPVLDSNGKLNPSVIPVTAITEVYVVADQAARLALTANVGDVAVQTDNHTSYILSAMPASVNSNWIAISSPTDAPVQSVNGKVGVVVLTAIDTTIGAYTQPAGSSLNITSTDTVNGAIYKIDSWSVGVNTRVTALETTIDGGTF